MSKAKLSFLIIITFIVLTIGIMTYRLFSKQNEADITQINELYKISENMTYGEVIALLGHEQDIGSGRYIYKYEFRDELELILNFASYEEKLRMEDYLHIKELSKRLDTTK